MTRSISDAEGTEQHRRAMADAIGRNLNKRAPADDRAHRDSIAFFHLYSPQIMEDLAEAETRFRKSDAIFEYSDTGASIRDASNLPLASTAQAPKTETEARIIRAMLACLAFPTEK